jgi:hypothetical protein
MLRALLGLAIILGLAGAARAQRAPDMATLDRGDGISKLGIDVGMSFIDDPYSLALRLELHGQYVSRSGLGIYGSLPLTSSFGAPGEDQDPVPPDLVPNDATALANAEIGGLYVATKSRRLSFVFRAGVSLPTATDGRDEQATLFAGAFPRLADFVNTSGDWYVRIGFSPLIYADRLFLRFDLGLDIALDEAHPHVLRLNLGGGVDLGVVALSLELVNNIAFFDGDEDYVDTLALTLRFMGERLQPYLAVGAPLDDSRETVQLFIAGGIQFVP